MESEFTTPTEQPNKSGPKDVVFIPMVEFFLEDEIIEATCDTENPEVCDACQ